jgi:hypothetical protein
MGFPKSVDSASFSLGGIELVRMMKKEQMLCHGSIVKVFMAVSVLHQNFAIELLITPAALKIYFSSFDRKIS